MSIRPRKRGRPRSEPADRKSNIVTIRMTDSLKQALEIVAQEEGRSLSGAIELCLERFFQQEHLYGHLYSARMFARLVAASFCMAGEAASVSRAVLTGEPGRDPFEPEDWTRDPYCFEAACMEVIYLLARYRPAGSMKAPERDFLETGFEMGKPWVNDKLRELTLGKLLSFFEARLRDQPHGQGKRLPAPAPSRATGLRADDVATKIGAFTALDERARRLRAEAASLSKEIEAQRRKAAKEVEGLGDLYAQSLKRVGEIDLPANVTGDGDYFTLRVKGDEMDLSGLFDGDTVVIERADYAIDGDIVAAEVDGEILLRHYHYNPKSEMVMLGPSNSDYEPIFLSPDKVTIRGRLVGMMKQYEPPSSEETKARIRAKIAKKFNLPASEVAREDRPKKQKKRSGSK